MSETHQPITWTDAPNGSSGRVQGKLVCQIRKLGVGGWSALWVNGLRWDVEESLPMSGIKAQASRHFKRRDSAKAAMARALETGEGLVQACCTP